MASANRSDDDRGSSDLDARVVLAAAEVLATEHDRLLKDAHDDVLDEVLAAALALATVLPQTDPVVRMTLQEALESLDRAVDLLRTAFVGSPLGDLGRIRPSRVMSEIAHGAQHSLGFQPSLHISGPIDELADARILGHLALTVRELLAAVAHGGTASTCDVTVRVADRIEVTVIDDGALGPRGALGGLADRAEALGGSFEIAAQPGGRGTVSRWVIPR